MTAFLRLAACVALVLLGSPVSAAVLYAIADPDEDDDWDDDDSDLDEDDDSDLDPCDRPDALAHPPTEDSDDVDDWPIPPDHGGEAIALTVRKGSVPDAAR